MSENKFKSSLIHTSLTQLPAQAAEVGSDPWAAATLQDTPAGVLAPNFGLIQTWVLQVLGE